MAVCDETKPYIFISYSHRDSDKVLEIMNRLKGEGFNVWYDGGIDPGTEWDENIAKHVRECEYFVAFISNGYIGSKNCKDELNFSRDLDKNQLLVYLEEVQLPDGMAMRMNRIQAIYWPKYNRNNIEEAYEKLFKASGIEKTRMIPAPSPMGDSVVGQYQQPQNNIVPGQMQQPQNNIVPGQMQQPQNYTVSGQMQQPQNNNPIKNSAKPRDKKQNSKAIISMVLGIISILLSCCCPYLGLFLGGGALVTADMYKKENNNYFDGMSKAGLICGCIGIALTLIAFVLMATGAYDPSMWYKE